MRRKTRFKKVEMVLKMVNMSKNENNKETEQILQLEFAVVFFIIVVDLLKPNLCQRYWDDK